MALNFPSNPTTGQTYQEEDSATYRYNGVFWTVVQPSPLEIVSASFASFAVSSSQATSASFAVFATTASSVTALSQSVLISGSLNVFNNELQVLSTGVNIGNITTDRHAITGSLGVSGSIVLSPTSVITGSTINQPTLVFAQNTSGQSINNTPIPFTVITNWSNIVAQNAAEWNQAAGTFTATKAGTYLVSTSLIYAARTAPSFGNQVWAMIQKNGTIQATGVNYAETGNSIPRGSTTATAIVSLAVGDVLAISTYHDFGSTSSLSLEGSQNTVTIQQIASRLIH
jgi:hypothetical protein